MAVSYLSKPFKSSSYVPPINLELLGRVLSIKQQQFDTGATRIQSGIDQLGNLDVMRGVDREYLNSKVNGLVSTINSLGGRDFSDPNILNQIEGLGSDIYGDQKVINAVASTKQVRKLFNGYEKMKTDPRLIKDYAKQNEFWDTENAQTWLNNTEVGKQYEGPSTPTPHVNYRQSHLSAFKQIVADKFEKETIDGYYIYKNSTERVTPDRVWAMAEELLTPEERQQMKIDGWYLANTPGYTPQNLIEKGLNQLNQRVEDAKNMKSYYEAQATAAVADPLLRMRFNALADQKANEISALSQDPLYKAESAVKKYQEDPKEFAYQVYKNDYFKGLSNRFSINRVSETVKPNTVAMFKDRQAQAQKNFDAALAQKDKQFYDKLSLDYLKAGFKMTFDPTTGAIVPISINPEDGRLSSTTINTQAPKDLKITDGSLTEANESLELQKQGIWDSFWSKFAGQYSELGVDVATSEGIKSRLFGREILEGQDKVFTLDDLAGFEKVAVKDDKGGQLYQNIINPDGTQTKVPVYKFKDERLVRQYEAALKKAGRSGTTQMLETLSNLWANYQAILNGKGQLVGDLPEGFVEAVNDVMLVNERIRGNNALRKAASELAYNKLGWSTEQINLWEDYQKDPKKYGKFVGKGREEISRPSLIVTDTRIKELEKDAKNKGIDFSKEKKNFYDNVSTRDVFQTKIFRDDDDRVKSGEISNFISAEVSRQGADLVSGNSKLSIPPKTAIAANKIKPIQMGMTSDGTGRFFIQSQVSIGEGEKKETGELIVYLRDTEAAKLGLTRDPLENINYSVNLTGESGDIPVYINKNLSFYIKIRDKNREDINDYSSFAKIIIPSLDASGKRIPGKDATVTLPGSDGLTPADSYRNAVSLLNKLGQWDLELRKAGQAGLTRNQIIEYLNQNR